MLLIKVAIYDIWINGFHFTHKDNIDDLQISVVYHTDVFCYHNAITLPLIHWMQTAYSSRLILVTKYETRALWIFRGFPHGTNSGLFIVVIYGAYEHS